MSANCRERSRDLPSLRPSALAPWRGSSENHASFRGLPIVGAPSKCWSCSARPRATSKKPTRPTPPTQQLRIGEHSPPAETKLLTELEGAEARRAALAEARPARVETAAPVADAGIAVADLGVRAGLGRRDRVAGARAAEGLARVVCSGTAAAVWTAGHDPATPVRGCAALLAAALGHGIAHALAGAVARVLRWTRAAVVVCATPVRRRATLPTRARGCGRRRDAHALVVLALVLPAGAAGTRVAARTAVAHRSTLAGASRGLRDGRAGGLACPCRAHQASAAGATWQCSAAAVGRRSARGAKARARARDAAADVGDAAAAAAVRRRAGAAVERRAAAGVDRTAVLAELRTGLAGAAATVGDAGAAAGLACRAGGAALEDVATAVRDLSAVGAEARARAGRAHLAAASVRSAAAAIEGSRARAAFEQVAAAIDLAAAFGALGRTRSRRALALPRDARESSGDARAARQQSAAAIWSVSAVGARAGTGRWLAGAAVGDARTPVAAAAHDDASAAVGEGSAIALGAGAAHALCVAETWRSVAAVQLGIAVVDARHQTAPVAAHDQDRDRHQQCSKTAHPPTIIHRRRSASAKVPERPQPRLLDVSVFMAVRSRRRPPRACSAPADQKPWPRGWCSRILPRTSARRRERAAGTRSARRRMPRSRGARCDARVRAPERARRRDRETASAARRHARAPCRCGCELRRRTSASRSSATMPSRSISIQDRLLSQCSQGEPRE